MKEKKPFPLKEFLIALGVTLAVFAAAMGVAVWQYQALISTFQTAIPVWLYAVNGGGALLLFLILFHYLKKSKDK